ncbi:MAG TPA: hypothetical protein VH253_07220 [Phycisphaerae bacterium]|nr:hypothetical protein [Phycisphaerae bacterium]
MESLSKERSVRLLLSVVAALLAANLFIQHGGGPRTAMAAGIPDSGAQMQLVVDQLKELNTKVDSLNSFLQSGKLVVDVKDPKGDK